MGIEELKEGNIKLFGDDLGSDHGFVYPFDCAPLDILFGGGVYSGKIYELSAWESQGKSTLALEMSKNFTKYWQSKGDDNYAVLWIETESSLDKLRAKWIGCQVDKFIICEAETVEEAFETIEKTLNKCVAKGVKLLIVWDTIAAAPTLNEKNVGQFAGGMGEKPRMIRAGLRKITTPLGKSNSTLILVNQLYQGLGGPGSGDETPGGGGIKFHCSFRGRLKRVADITGVSPNGENRAVGIITELTSIKNKLTLPKQKCQISLYGETGIDKLETVTNYLKLNKILNVGAAGWTTIHAPLVEGNSDLSEIKFQSLYKLKEKIKDLPHIFDYLQYLVYEYATRTSPLMKVKIVGKVWEYEERFFKERRTKLDEKEMDIAKDLYKQIHNDLKEEENKIAD